MLPPRVDMQLSRCVGTATGTSARRARSAQWWKRLSSSARQSGKLGHLRREDAADYRPIFDELRRRGFDGASCVGKLVGGTHDKPSFGVVLKLSQPWFCAETLNTEPEAR